MERKLTGIPETMLIPLWAKSVESTRSDPIISDPKAVEIVSRMDYDFSRFSRSWLSQVGVAVRTRILDDAVLDFLSRNPGAVVVNLGAGLDTRYERLKNENIGCWYDLDVPEAITFRRMFFSESERNRFIAESVFNLSWLKNIESRSGPALVIAEGLLMYFSEFELKALFRSMAARLSGSEMLFEMLAPMLVGRSKYHDSVNRIGGKIEFKWGLRTAGPWKTGVRPSSGSKSGIITNTIKTDGNGLAFSAGCRLLGQDCQTG